MSEPSNGIDMSPQAIAARIRKVVALNRLCASLVAAGRLARERGEIK